MGTSVLLRRRQALLREIRSVGPVFRGSVVERSLTCGKEHCCCRKGQRHTAFYLSFRAGGRAYGVELPRRFASEAKRLQKSWLEEAATAETWECPACGAISPRSCDKAGDPPFDEIELKTTRGPVAFQGPLFYCKRGRSSFSPGAGSV